MSAFDTCGDAGALALYLVEDNFADAQVQRRDFQLFVFVDVFHSFFDELCMIIFIVAGLRFLFLCASFWDLLLFCI